MGELVLNASYQLLKLGRRDRDMVAIGPLMCATDQMALLAQHAKQCTADLDNSVELAFNFLQVSIDDPNDLNVIRQLRPAYSEAKLRRLATVLDGSVSAAVSRIRRYHQEFGISFVTLHMSAASSWSTMERIAVALR